MHKYHKMCACVCWVQYVDPYMCVHARSKHARNVVCYLYLSLILPQNFVASYNSQISFRKLNINTLSFKYTRIALLFREVEAELDFLKSWLNCLVVLCFTCFLITLSAAIIYNMLQ